MVKCHVALDHDKYNLHTQMIHKKLKYELTDIKSVILKQK